MEREGIGPRLGGITNMLDEKYLLSFISDPAKTVESGNPRAVALTRRYRMIMPAFGFLKPEEMKDIIAYIRNETDTRHISPLAVDETQTGTLDRLAAPVTKSGLTITLEDFIKIPPSAEKMPLTRIATMRPHPAGDGTLFVSDQRGMIYRIRDGVVNQFLDIKPLTDNFVTEPGLGTGLGSFAFHPDYMSNGLMYITHTEKFTGKKADYEYHDSIEVSLQWVLSELKIKDVRGATFEGSRRELLRINVPDVVHGVQDIGFVPGSGRNDEDFGLLYMGIGDGGSTIGKHPELCHKTISLLGTIIRIDPLGNNSKNGRYGIPAGNPFVQNPDPETRKEIYALGFRNPHRLSWDNGPERRLFSADVGESNFEEVNLVVKGGDYGWNAREGSYAIAPADLKNVFKIPETDTAHYIDPFAVYDHIDGNAISGGYVYHGKLTALEGMYLFGDIVNGRLFYVDTRPGATDRAVHELTIKTASGLTDLKQLSGSRRVDVRIEFNRYHGEMYILTKPDGMIRRIREAGVSQ